MIVRRRRGLSLVELLVVLAVIAIASAAIVPSFGSRLRSARIHQAAYLFAEHLRYAQLLSIEKERPVRVVLERAHGGYRVELATSLDGQESGTAPGVPSPRISLPEGVSFGDGRADVSAASAEEILVFDPAGAWAFSDVGLTDGRTRYAIRVCSGMGPVEVVDVSAQSGQPEESNLADLPVEDR